jgi:hypothetical protein
MYIYVFLFPLLYYNYSCIYLYKGYASYIHISRGYVKHKMLRTTGLADAGVVKPIATNYKILHISFSRFMIFPQTNKKNTWNISQCCCRFGKEHTESYVLGPRDNRSFQLLTNCILIEWALLYQERSVASDIDLVLPREYLSLAYRDMTYGGLPSQGSLFCNFIHNFPVHPPSSPGHWPLEHWLHSTSETFNRAPHSRMSKNSDNSD